MSEGVKKEKLSAAEFKQIRKEEYKDTYELVYWKDYNYAKLMHIWTMKRSGTGKHDSYNDAVIMADTETSKGDIKGINENHLVAFTISIRAYEQNIVTLYGSDPEDLIDCIARIKINMPGDKTIMYFHNLSYDWVFIRRFLFVRFGTPLKMLATKPHYPIYIEFNNGLILKDSYILSQRSLEKWAKDLQVEHQKAVGKWDYLKIRNQSENFTPAELEYIEHDTLAGVECLDKTMQALNKRIYSMPYTATGIPREEVRKRAKTANGRNLFDRIVPKDYNTQVKLENVFHGGYTHANRHYIGVTVNNVKALDFTSSYPYCMLAFKFPMSEFKPFKNLKVEEVMKLAPKYALMFKAIFVNVRLKTDKCPMPALQYSKAVADINALCDNGRILAANYIEIYLNEIDLEVILEQYDYKAAYCIEVEYASKDYLPRWYTDYVYECFTEKTMLKGGDPVLYSIAKSKVNSLYGLSVQRPCREDLKENYVTGEYTVENGDMEAKYAEYLKNKNSILPYQWGVWVTSYAFRNLFILGSCCKLWLYSDTDSCYGKFWDLDKVNKYNEGCKEKLRLNGYGPVMRGDKEYFLGVTDAEDHLKFRTLGAKRYCTLDSDSLHITVAGVPKKKGAACLKSIDDFQEGFIFSGSKTGKQTHTYFFNEEIHEDAAGNKIGDSIDLSPCDYLLSKVQTYDWEDLFNEDIEVQTYEN